MNISNLTYDLSELWFHTNGQTDGDDTFYTINRAYYLSSLYKIFNILIKIPHSQIGIARSTQLNSICV